MTKDRQPRPTRIARYSVGPGLERWIPTAAMAMIGAATIMPTAAIKMSSRRLAIAQCPADRDEHFSRVHALLIAPCAGSMAQRFE